ncbi:MAG: ATP-binding protein, partial [Actinomycetota bacterium]
MRIRVRLTLVFTVMMTVVIAAAGLTLIVRLRAELRSTLDDALSTRAGVIRTVSGQGPRLPKGLSLKEPDESFAQIVGVDGRVKEASAGLPRQPLVNSEVIERLGAPEFFERNVVIAGEEIPTRILAVKLGGGDVLLVGASLEDQQEAVKVLAGLLAIGGPMALCLAAILVWSLTGAALKPVERMREEADALSISDVGRPLALPRTDDEIARLGASLNSLLARLAQALQRERRFVDDASHELRTPVATLKAELELALSGDRTHEEMRSALEAALADADDLALLTEDLLVLARADHGRLPIRKSEVDLAELLGQVTEGFRLRARADGVSLHLDARGTHSVDPLRLRQVVNNLVDNALRNCPPGGSVSVRSVHDDGVLILEVEDTGLGFPSEVLTSPFEPFTRSGEERATDGGAGLGLSIVKAIVEA